ncbi:hypothetical protein GCM10022281_17470 [Sphingomonas rosea]|uniref:DUF3253 domain-containing protein n=1 Tax=Sphingomonas rosea TaxID=335605 RepID=A0ABP7U7K5_9SPHN
MTADARTTTLAMLANRKPAYTICPSEVARALASGENWRAAMPEVHSAVDCLLDEGAIRLSWKGQQLVSRAGPYRIGIAAAQTDRSCKPATD